MWLNKDLSWNTLKDGPARKKLSPMALYAQASSLQHIIFKDETHSYDRVKWSVIVSRALMCLEIFILDRVTSYFPMNSQGGMEAKGSSPRRWTLGTFHLTSVDTARRFSNWYIFILWFRHDTHPPPTDLQADPLQPIVWCSLQSVGRDHAWRSCNQRKGSPPTNLCFEQYWSSSSTSFRGHDLESLLPSARMRL